MNIDSLNAFRSLELTKANKASSDDERDAKRVDLTVSQHLWPTKYRCSSAIIGSTYPLCAASIARFSSVRIFTHDTGRECNTAIRTSIRRLSRTLPKAVHGSSFIYVAHCDSQRKGYSHREISTRLKFDKNLTHDGCDRLSIVGRNYERPLPPRWIFQFLMTSVSTQFDTEPEFYVIAKLETFRIISPTSCTHFRGRNHQRVRSC